MSQKQLIAGFTLIELLITIAIAAILLSIGVPSMSSLLDAQRVKSAGSQVYSHIQQARSEAISRKEPVYLNFSADGSTSWTYGLSTLNNCTLTQTDATHAAACTLVVDDGDGTVHDLNGAVDTGDKVLMRFSDTDHIDIAMTTANFTSGTQITFDPVRGAAIGATGDILLTSADGLQLMVKVAPLGQIRICSPDGSVTGYADALPGDDTDC